jgi:hypothetical protein
MWYCCDGRFDAAVDRFCRQWCCAGGAFDDDNENEIEQEKGGRNKVKRFDLRCIWLFGISCGDRRCCCLLFDTLV